MYNIVVFDDDKAQCELIANMVKELDASDVSVYNVVCTFSREEVEQMVDDGEKIDILISDIFLEGDGKNGIDVAKDILLRGMGTQIIYITGFVEYCEAVYETEHVYFLRKPVKQANLSAALSKAVSMLEEYRRKVYPISFNGRITNVPIQDIFYVESNKRKLEYMCKKAVYESYGKLDDVERILGAEFVRCHKSFLVNMRYIKELKQNQLLLENGKTIIVSRSYYNHTKDCLLRYVIG